MTGSGMNATLDRVGWWSRAAAVCGLAGLMAGCMSYDPFNRATDPNSPAAQRVESLARADQAFPRWEDFPAEPQNVPTTADIRNQVVALQGADSALDRDVAAIVWTLNEDDGEPWAARTRNRVNMRLAQAVDPAAVAEALAWAERQRARSQPPPPLND